MTGGQWTLLFALLRLAVEPQARIAESVVVTAPGVPRIAVAATATVLTRDDLETSPSLTLDQQLGSTPGFSLFRRTSSRTANPTTQGLTLRGFAASGASRTAVFADGVPLNDPFGGWVYWARVPRIMIGRVEVARAGASDREGNDALAGAVRIVTRRDDAVEAGLTAGTQGTGRASAFAGRNGPLSAYAGAEWGTTDGYIPVEPSSRGRADQPAGSGHWSALARAGGSVSGARIEAGMTFMDERRTNGTRLQQNATSVAAAFLSASGRVLGGEWNARGLLQTQDYDQTFSAVFDNRDQERLTSGQAIDVSASQSDVAWSRAGTSGSVLLSAFGRDLDGHSIERTFLPNGAILSIEGPLPRQGSLGAGAQGLRRLSDRVTLNGGARVEYWSSEASPGQWLVAPRADLSTRVSPAATLRLSAYSGYRTATVNERVRSFRVGDVLTLANPALEPERSKGIEAAATVTGASVTWRAVGFWSRLDGAIYSRTLDGVVMPGVSIVRQRDNGDVRAAGLELETDARIASSVRGWFGATLISSTFTSGELAGRRVPQVPRAQIAAGLRASRGPWIASLDVRHASPQFDDDRNVFELRRATTANALVMARAGRARAFVSVENLLDADIDAGRTPLRTIGQPRVWHAGVRVGGRR